MPPYRASADLGAFNGQIVGAVDGRREEGRSAGEIRAREGISELYTEDVEFEPRIFSR